jgi:intracellular multiplication protein IcmV
MADEKRPAQPQSQPQQMQSAQVAAKPVKPPKKKRVRKFLKSWINVRAWVGYDEIKSNTQNVISAVKTVYSTKTPVARTETFEEAIARMGLTEETLDKRKKYFLHFSMFYSLVALALITYAVIMFFTSHSIVGLLSLLLVGIMLLYAYHEHFWYMQMHKRRLGCTFKDWLAFILGRA